MEKEEEEGRFTGKQLGHKDRPATRGEMQDINSTQEGMLHLKFNF